MNSIPVKILKYGVDVWSHPMTEFLRKTECLCLNCSDMGNCEAAHALLMVCKDSNLALMVTRCPKFRIK